MLFTRKLISPLLVGLFVVFILAMIQLKVERPMLILERIFKGGGWIEIPLIAGYGMFLYQKMSNPVHSARWRLFSWTLFSGVFFGQLLLGLAGLDIFLMTGKLHLPIPMMILGGPVYRSELSFMTILFLSTILITGPAWCSHLCYFGALDNLASSRKSPKRGSIKNLGGIKATGLVAIVMVILLLKWFEVATIYATILGISFGVIGLMILLFLSRRKGKMIHCLTWCPIGTIVNYARFVNPFRMAIDPVTCTKCNACTKHCRYDALLPEDISNGKPGITCTLCGDCLTSCHASSIHYRFFKLPREVARNLYLFLTVSSHVIFLALARI